MTGFVKQFVYDGKESEVVIDSAKIIIYDDAQNVLDVYYSNKFGKCDFRIPLFKNVVIKVAKENYVLKTISVNTWVPKNNNSFYTLSYDIYLFEKIDCIDASILDRPIANIKFENVSNSFGYDRNYSNVINQGLKKMYWNFYHKTEKGDLYKNECINSFVDSPTVISNTIINNMADEEKAISDIEFQVQILALKEGQIPLDSPTFLNCKNVTEEFSEGFFKYTIGKFPSLPESQELLEKLIQKGFPDAFIVAVKNNKRIAVGEAINFQINASR